MTFINDPQYRWHSEEQEHGHLYYKGAKDIAVTAMGLVQQHPPSKLVKTLEKYFKSIKHYTSGTIETDELIIAWVDHIKSWPIFYTHTKERFLCSNNARRIQEKTNINKIDITSHIEMAMSGFISGKETIYKDLYALQPGEFFVFNKKKNTLTTSQYFRYTPDFSNSRETKENQKDLNQILDTITREIIEKANGKTIWVPLSAGLDSRILLCKLHEHQYPHIQTFTYGPKYNFEALHAKRIAKTLNVPWRMITLPTKTIRKLFEDETRKEFWRYADHLKAIPCMREYSAISYLHNNKITKPGDIFLNGQSGDFITGGHIPDICFQTSDIDTKTLLETITDKHYDLWSSLKTKDNLKRIANKIGTLMPSDWQTKTNATDRAGQSEIWEYEARQICYVVNGQRIYEFFDFEWEMPLWDKRLIDFCETLSMADKHKQSLYKSYLQDYNYKNLFPENEPHLWRWPIPMLWVLPIAQLIGLIAGKSAKDNFYAKMRYYGHYSNQYAFFPSIYHNSTYKKARNIVSLYTASWLKENEFPIVDEHE